VAALALLVPPGARAVGHERIPLDHWCYGALERFESLGLCVLADDRPFTRDEIVRLTERVTDAAGRVSLSQRDRYELDRLEREFTAPASRDDPAERYDRAWFARDGSAAIEADLAVRPFVERAPFADETEAFVGADPEFRAHFGERITYDLRYRLLFGPEHGERARDEKPSRREKSFKGLTSLFERSYLALTWDHVEVFFGRDHLDWGPAAGGNLIMPGARHSIDQMHARFRFRALRLDAMYGQLFTQPERYLAGHRLEWQAGRTVLGLSETVVYGGRPLDWLYVWPVAWYYANQFNERSNNDNILWSVDAKTSVLDALTLYGSLLVDDFQFERDDGYPDKLAADAGFRWVPARPLGLAVRGQYRWADVYTYSHFDSLSVYISGAGELAGGDVLLGARPGPDADAWSVDADAFPRSNLLVSVGVFARRVGEGNDVRAFELGVDERNPPFPSGVVEETVGFRARARWEFTGDRWVSASYAHLDADNRAHAAGADEASDAFRLEIRWDIP
jgi:hypothetical protein